MPTTKGLPSETFDLIPALLPHLAIIFARCELTAAEIFTITHIKHFGKERSNGQRVILRTALVEELYKVLHQNHSASGMAGFLTEMVNRQLLIKSSLTEEEKTQW